MLLAAVLGGAALAGAAESKPETSASASTVLSLRFFNLLHQILLREE